MGQEKKKKRNGSERSRKYYHKILGSLDKLKLNCNIKHPWDKPKPGKSRTISFEAIPPVIHSFTLKRSRDRKWGFEEQSWDSERREAGSKQQKTQKQAELPAIKHIIIWDFLTTGLRFWASNVGAIGSIPDQGTKIQSVAAPKKIKNKKTWFQN